MLSLLRDTTLFVSPIKSVGGLPPPPRINMMTMRSFNTYTYGVMFTDRSLLRSAVCMTHDLRSDL